MNTQTIDVVLQPGQNATINITRLARRTREQKESFLDKDEHGDFTLLDHKGKPLSRLNSRHLSAIFKNGHASFNVDASTRLGGSMGIISRMHVAITNIKHEYKKGHLLYGTGGNIPRITDYVVDTDSSGRITVDRKF